MFMHISACTYRYTQISVDVIWLYIYIYNNHTHNKSFKFVSESTYTYKYMWIHSNSYDNQPYNQPFIQIVYIYIQYRWYRSIYIYKSLIYHIRINHYTNHCDAMPAVDDPGHFTPQHLGVAESEQPGEGSAEARKRCAAGVSWPRFEWDQPWSWV